MKLKKLDIRQFCNFIDQELWLDPRMTVLVGRNDVGKTNLLSWLLEQHYSVGVGAGAARSQLPDIPQEERRVEYAMTWGVGDEESKMFDMPTLLGVENIRTICVGHEMMREPESADKRPWTIVINGEEKDYYLPRNESGEYRLRSNAVKLLQDILPKVRYILLSERQLMPFRFEFRLFAPTPEMSGLLPDSRRDEVVTEQVLLGMMGWRADTRFIPATSRSWEQAGLLQPLDIPIQELKERLQEISTQITKALREWWCDPPNLTFNITVAGHRDRYGSYAAEITIVDQAGLKCQGTGLRWFLAFLIEVLDIQRSNDSRLLLFDEPANHLHPSAQKVVLKILNELSKRSQIVYATHSPFMIDWSFPQRVRLLERADTRRTHINNKPYASAGSLNPWDPARISVGVTLGDLGLLGNENILVEGVSDHVLIANISEFLAASGRSSLPKNIAIIPIGSNEGELKRIITIAQNENRKLVLLHDSDSGGEKLRNCAAEKNVRAVSLRTVLSAALPVQTLAIEDLIQPNIYLEAVNKYYEHSHGFKPEFAPITKESLNTICPDNNETITSRLKIYFERRFKQAPTFNKASVAVQIADMIGNGWQGDGFQPFEQLIGQLLTNLGS